MIVRALAFEIPFQRQSEWLCFFHLAHLGMNLQMAFEGSTYFIFQIYFSQVPLAGGTHDFRYFSGNELSEV